MADIELKLFAVPVVYRDGTQAQARAEGLSAAWICKRGESLPLVGRGYFQFGHDCHTVCPACKRKYRVLRDQNKRTSKVQEL